MSIIAEIKQNDTLRPLRVALMRDGALINDDLAGAFVRFILQRIDEDQVPVGEALSLLGSVEDNEKKIVRYDWQEGDTATAGTYLAEVEVTYANGFVETFPTRGYDTVIMHADLG